MKFTISRFFVILMTLCVLASTAAAQSVNISLKDGSRWRGQVNDTVTVKILERGIENAYDGKIIRAGDSYITIETMMSGAMRQKTIFFGDIVSISSAGGPAETPKADVPATPTGAASSATSAKPAATGRDIQASQKKPDAAAGQSRGVFYLPMEGGVGDEIRHEEIELIGKEADKHGPGQIIVILINTNGGLVLESELIDETIADLQKRHRVVAWVKKAISAGCSLAMACSEIYFMTEGTAGSVTTVRGTQSVAEEEVQTHIEALVQAAKRNGYSEHIARAMKLNKYMCSYDKDPVTGDITWYGDTSGQYVLSDDQSNLCFNSSNAEHCRFSKGTADTFEDIARKLDLPEWKEVNTYGRQISQRWKDTVERAQLEIPRLLTQRQFKGTSGGAVERLGTLIRINEQLIGWINRAPNVALYSFGLQKENLQREIAEWRKQLADMQRRDRDE
jgi:ATP-dependent protease ClpP protease subunit